MNNWINVKDRLPEKPTHKGTHDFDVLLFVPKRDGCHQHGIYIGTLGKIKGSRNNIFGIQTKDCDWTIWGWSYYEHPIVTHWMPLPELPDEEKETANHDE